MRDAYIISAVRTAVGKALKGSLRATRPDEMAAVVIAEAIARVDGLEKGRVDDVVLGCAMPEAEQGLNVARLALLRAGVPFTTTGMTINRFCSSGLEAIHVGASQIQLGEADVVVAGGTESMSLVPMSGNKPCPNPTLVEQYPQAYIGMGITAEKVAKKYGVSREDQDVFSMNSHKKAAEAIKNKKFEDEIVPLKVKNAVVNSKNRVEITEFEFAVDEGVRADTTVEALAKLKPAFMTPQAGGTVTAGNSSQMSDGAAAVVLVSKDVVEQLGVKPMAKFVAYATAGVEPEIMGIGPVKAIPKVLERTGLRLDDVGVIELNEAFAAQSLAVVRELDLPEERTNVNGGAIALGHPLGCTGAKLTVSLLYEMKRRGAEHGIVSMCIGGGMGAAGVFQLIK